MSEYIILKTMTFDDFINKLKNMGFKNTYNSGSLSNIRHFEIPFEKRIDVKINYIFFEDLREVEFNIADGDSTNVFFITTDEAIEIPFNKVFSLEVV